MIFGNRKLALKGFASRSQQQVYMTCIVHDLDHRRGSIPNNLLAKFLDATTIENEGAFASIFSKTLKTDSIHYS